MIVIVKIISIDVDAGLTIPIIVTTPIIPIMANMNVVQGMGTGQDTVLALAMVKDLAMGTDQDTAMIQEMDVGILAAVLATVMVLGAVVVGLAVVVLVMVALVVVALAEEAVVVVVEEVALAVVEEVVVVTLVAEILGEVVVALVVGEEVLGVEDIPVEVEGVGKALDTAMVVADQDMEDGQTTEDVVDDVVPVTYSIFHRDSARRTTRSGS